MTNIFAGLGIICLGVFAILLFIRALKEQDVIDTHNKEKQWHMNLTPSLNNETLGTWWTPEFAAMRNRYGIEPPSDDNAATAQLAADAFSTLYNKCEIEVPLPLRFVQHTIDPDKYDVIFSFDEPLCDESGSIIPNYFECEGTAEDAEKIGLKL